MKKTMSKRFASITAGFNSRTLPGADDITRVELENGIVVLARCNPYSPSVVFSGYLSCGSLYDPADKLGLAHFTALMLTRGTTQRTFHQIFDAMESVGGSMGFGASVHSTSFGGRSLTEDLPMMFDLLSETLRQPVFPAEHVERLRAQLLTNLAMRNQDTADRAEMAFDEIVFANHPYGRPEEGHPETVQSISREDMMKFHQQRFGPAGMVIVLVGALTGDQAVEQVQRALGDWKNPLQGETSEGNVLPDAPLPLQETVRKHIFLPGKTQTDLEMGTLGPRRTAPEYLAASLGNNILGQFGLMGRIGDVVREQAGLAYHASTTLNAWPASGSWEVSAGVNPANLNKAVDLIRQELERFVREPVTQEELTDSQANYIGRLPLSLESNMGVASALLSLERFKLGLDYYRNYPDKVAAVTVEHVLEAARAYIDPSKLAIVSAGPE